jgi:hypothetical protein
MNQIDINESGLRAVDEAVFGEWPRQESSLVIAARAAGSAADVTAVAPEAVAMSDEALRAEWAGSSELQREFSTPGTYSAYQRAHENGQAKILARPTPLRSRVPRRRTRA